MTNSAHYRRLSKRFNSLRRRFLPRKFSPTGDYTETIIDRARAFSLLVHAELEHFLETRALEIANKAHDAWNQNRITSKPLLCLLSNFQGNTSGLPKKLGTNVSSASIIGKCLAQFRHSVSQNHGIKTESILTLFLPIGVDEGDLDVTWLAALDTFGTTRGTAAHASGITYTLDPKTEWDLTETIFNGLKDFDINLNSIQRGVR